MHTVTKKELVDRISDQTRTKRVVVKSVIQSFLDEIIDESRLSPDWLLTGIERFVKEREARLSHVQAELDAARR